MAYYKDLAEYIKALDERGKLVRVSHPVNKDTEIHPLVRLQFRGLPEEERKAFYFDNVTDTKGRKYSIPVAIGVLGASPQVYAVGMMCDVSEIAAKWQYAQAHPVKPVMADSGPVQEQVLTGEALARSMGMGQFPIPVSSPGWDIAPYVTSASWVTKDPESGIRNVGTYRAHIKAPLRTGIHAAKYFRGIAYHWRKCHKLGRPLEAAMVVGVPPHVGYVSVSQLPTDVDEFDVAGGIAGEPVPLVKCKTVDLEVPANADIVMEGTISTTELEPEAPFGEATGYVGQREMSFVFTINCITRRRDPIWQAFISQYPPSESSVIRQIGSGNAILARLRQLGISHVIEPAVHFSNGSDRYVILKMAKTDSQEIWQALEAMPKQFAAFSKIIVAVDEDIDPWDANMVNWAITYRCQPHRDIRIVNTHAPDTCDYSVHEPETEYTQVTAFDKEPEKMPACSVLLMDATMKWPYPPVSLPKKEYMDEALRIWQGLGLPQLHLKAPWYGYDLGNWDDEKEKQAALAARGEHYETGRLLEQRRFKL